MAENATYQTKVYTEQGGDKQVIKSDGVFECANQEILAQDLARVVHSNQSPIIIGQGATSNVLSVINQPANCKFITLSMTSTMVTGSFWLTSCSAGAEVFLFLASGSTQSGAVDVSLSGVTLLGSIGVPITSFTMYNSAASTPGLHMVAMKDNVWSIVSEFGDING